MSGDLHTIRAQERQDRREKRAHCLERLTLDAYRQGKRERGRRLEACYHQARHAAHAGRWALILES